MLPMSGEAGETSSSGTFEPSAERTWVGDEEVSAEVLAERYTVLVELGRGAIGVVERVFDAHLDRTVARKRLLDDRPASHRRFVREARITASLAHAGIPPVFDLGVDDASVPYYTMQEIVGRPWKDLVKEARSLEARLAQLDILLAVARAAAHAHERGFVHRDLKLANVMVGALGDAFVVDWGLCVPVGHQGPLAGTPQYMSPEQARGEPIAPDADVWALGVLLFRLLAGRAPHDVSSAGEVLERARAGVFPDVAEAAPGAPPELVAMVRKATAADRADRYPDASAFAMDLKAFLQGQWVTAHDYSVNELVHRLWRLHRSRLLAGLAGGAVLAAITASAGVAIRDQRDRAVQAEARALQQLAVALEASAAAARPDRWEPEAELAAARALQLDPNRPRAWGVLARHAGTDHPRLAWSTALPCPAVGAADHQLLLDCPHAFSVANLGADGTVSPMRPLVLPPLIPGDEQARHFLAGDLLARHRSDGQDGVVRISTGEVISRPGLTAVGAGERDGVPGLVLRDDREVFWLTEPDGEPLSLGEAPEGHRVVLDGADLYLTVPTRGLQRCTGVPLACEIILDAVGISHVAASDGWVVAEDVATGLHILRVPGEGQEPVHVELPTDAGAYTQLMIVAGFVAALRTEGDVDVWSLDGQAVARLPTHDLHPTDIGALGDRLLILGRRVDAWDLGTTDRSNRSMVSGAVAHREGVPVSAEREHLVLLDEPRREGPGIGGVAKAVDVADDGAVWASVSKGSLVRWDPATDRTDDLGTVGTSIRRLAAVPGGAVLAMDYAKRVFRVAADGTVREASGRCFGDVARSEDRTVVVCGHHDRLIELDPATGAEVRELAREERALWALAVTPDGSRVTYARHDHGLVEVDRVTGATRTVPPAHDGFVAAMAYSPDGRWLATGSWDQRIHLYDAATLDLVAVLEGHRGRVVALDFIRPDELASIGWDQVLWRWNLSVLDQPPEEHLVRVLGEVGGHAAPTPR